MKKFSELGYIRPDFPKEKQAIQQYIEHIKQAENYQTIRMLFLEREKEKRSFATKVEIALIRNSIDTTDAFYEEEVNYINEEEPILDLLRKEADKTLLESSFLPEFEAEFGSLIVKNMKTKQRLSNEKVVSDFVEEANLKQRYTKIIATCKTEFRGEECNFYGLLKHMQSTNREERKEAFLKWAELYESVSVELDDIYDKLIQLRNGIAKTLGFDSYIDMAYLEKQRYDYNAEDVARFRKQIVETVVPVCEKLYEMQRNRLHIDKLYFYDETFVYPDGNPVPIGKKEDLVKAAQKMYQELSKETGMFFDTMVEYELFDLDTKDGKSGGGYCTFLEEYNVPFIFSNFNGTSADVDVLTHEAGHAFEGYVSAKKQKLSEQIFSTNEVNEIHSMSMEHFAYPWMKEFFGEKAEQSIYAHLCSAFTCIPYLVCVDEFQHCIFEKPFVTAKERRQIWKELEQKYMPWREYNGNSFLEEGGFWMQKQHIFLYPFYYIEYALAQMGAFEFYGKMKENRELAWEKYYKLCEAGGSKGYFELLELAGLSNPFQEGTVEKIVKKMEEELIRV